MQFLDALKPKPIGTKAFRIRAAVLILANCGGSLISYFIFWKAYQAGSLDRAILILVTMLGIQFVCLLLFGRSVRARLEHIDPATSLWNRFGVIAALICPISSFFYLWSLMTAERERPQRVQKFLLRSSTASVFLGLIVLSLPVGSLAYVVYEGPLRTRYFPLVVEIAKWTGTPTTQYLVRLTANVDSVVSMKNEQMSKLAQSHGLPVYGPRTSANRGILNAYEQLAQRSQIGAQEMMLTQMAISVISLNQRKREPATSKIEIALDLADGVVETIEIFERHHNVLKQFNWFSVGTLAGSLEAGLMMSVDRVVTMHAGVKLIPTVEMILNKARVQAEREPAQEQQRYLPRIDSIQNRLDQTVAHRHYVALTDPNSQQVLAKNWLQITPVSAPGNRSTASPAIE